MKNQGGGGVSSVVIFFCFCVKCDISRSFIKKLYTKLSILKPYILISLLNIIIYKNKYKYKHKPSKKIPIIPN